MDHLEDTRAPVQHHLPVPAIARAFEILDLLTSGSEAYSLQTIHTKLSLPKTSVHSMLCTLQACGAVVKLPNGTYRPGIRLYTLGMAVRAKLENTVHLLPILEKLRDVLGFTVFFSIYDDGDQVVWEKVEGRESVYFKAYSGMRKRLNTSSAGKAIAAYLSEDALEHALSKGLDSLTENSITDREAFLDCLKITREKGYAIDDEEGERGIFCIGVPVFDAQNRVFGAVSVSTLKSRIDPDKMEYYLAMLKKVAAEIMRIL